MDHEETLTISRDKRVGQFTTVTHVTEFYCPACTTGIIAHEDVDVDAFLAEHFGCVPDGYEADARGGGAAMAAAA